MKKSAKNKVFETLISITNQEGAPSATAADIASILNISRQNVSHYLTRLMEEGVVDKISGKPVYWKPTKQNMLENSNGEINSFQNVVGYDGSLREIIQKCISAVKYPPNGLNILINGSTGVGKSFLANQIFNYAKEVGIIGQSAPLSVLQITRIILNCYLQHCLDIKREHLPELKKIPKDYCLTQMEDIFF